MPLSGRTRKKSAQARDSLSAAELTRFGAMSQKVNGALARGVNGGGFSDSHFPTNTLLDLAPSMPRGHCLKPDASFMPFPPASVVACTSGNSLDVSDLRTELSGSSDTVHNLSL